jgi:hypothetical protein
MRSPSSFVRLAAVAALVALTTGCATRREHRELLKGIETKQIELDPRHTRAPKLTLTVPARYESDWTAQASYDTFILIDPGDDSDVQRGMLVIRVTPSPITQIPDSVKPRRVRSSLGEETIEWREFAFTDDQGVRVHQREATHDDIFKLFKDPKSGQSLRLSLFVVGSDSLLVEQLMGSAETIVAGGGRPDA